MSVAIKKEAFEEYPILDEKKLQSIKDLADGDDNFFKELTDLFFERVPVLMSEMNLAFQAKDSYKLERSSHALKGTAGNLGAMKMMKICEELENMGRGETFEGADLRLRELSEVYPLTEKGLKDDWI